MSLLKRKPSLAEKNARFLDREVKQGRMSNAEATHTLNAVARVAAAKQAARIR